MRLQNKTIKVRIYIYLIYLFLKFLNKNKFSFKVSFARPSSDSIKGANLYVCGLHKDFSQSDLEKMFTQFGTIISSKILADSKTGKRKWAFYFFSSSNLKYRI